MLRISLFVFGIVLFCLPAQASEIDTNTAKMQAMDKITGRVSVINVPVGGGLDFGSLSIVVRSCKTRPAEETPDNFAFVDISDKNLKGEEFNVFKGWMISSSPATNALEHPIYDVWLLQCVDAEIDKSLLWSEEKLAKRDELPSENNTEMVNLKKTDKINERISEMTAEHEPENLLPNEENGEFSYDDEMSVESENNGEETDVFADEDDIEIVDEEGNPIQSFEE
ncbi:MAG: DUF2155 domain-containing protein [Alphaproteobacteria bacterium]|nr:DUF2155 domain-containing protein [Alphaproteobacteria bacterium]